MTSHMTSEELFAELGEEKAREMIRLLDEERKRTHGKFSYRIDPDYTMTFWVEVTKGPARRIKLDSCQMQYGGMNIKLPGQQYIEAPEFKRVQVWRGTVPPECLEITPYDKSKRRSA